MLSMSWRMVRLLTDKYENDTLEDRKNDMAEEADLAETAPLIVCDSLVKIYKTKEVEVLALQGLDLTVNRGLSEEYFNKLVSPLKGFYTFEDSAHSPMFEEPERFLEIMISDVLNGIADQRFSAFPD